jgi:hypothetical protein
MRNGPDGCAKCRRLRAVVSVFAEELVGIFHEADSDYDSRTGHAHKEQDLKNTHQENAEDHTYNCSCDFSRFREYGRTGNVLVSTKR